MTLADALQQHKDQTGKTTQDIAKALGISQTFARDMVIGRRVAKRRQDVEALAAMLGVSTDFVDHMCARVPPDMVEFLSGDYGQVERIREGMTAR